MCLSPPGKHDVSPRPGPVRGSLGMRQVSFLPTHRPTARNNGGVLDRGEGQSERRRYEWQAISALDDDLSRSRQPHAGVAKADDVGSPVAGGVGQEPRMPIDPPAARIIAEVCDHQSWGVEGAVGQRT